SVVVALADKLDRLVGFWTIGEKPSGSKDPQALRRAALGVIRIILDNKARLRLSACLFYRLIMVLSQIQRGHLPDPEDPELTYDKLVTDFSDRFVALDQVVKVAQSMKGYTVDIESSLTNVAASVADLLVFFAERLKFQLREQGARHDLVDAVFALPA